MSKASDYRVIVGIDFGTTHSGFAYAHLKNKTDISIYIDWAEYTGRYKVPTALLYDDDFKSVLSWGFPALAKRPKRKKESERKPVELFKLHLGKMKDKPALPEGFDYKKAISDYLREFGKVIKKSLAEKWDIDFFNQVLLIFTIPTEFDDNAILIMRECIYTAGLLKVRYSRNLRFITEPDAGAIYCMKSLKEHNLSVGANFMMVDCGDDLVDLTTRQLLEGETLSEIIERSGGYCGGSFVDQEFLKFLESKVGANAIRLVKDNHYGQLQFMVQDFVRMVKMKFTGDPSEFETFELELDVICPTIKQYCKKEYLDKMEEVDWYISLKFDDVKKMFDPIVKKIIQLIDTQLHLINNNCSAILMIGEFSESKYLQSRIKQEYSSKVKLVCIPFQPAIAIIKGAVEYGLNCVIPYISFDEEIQSLYEEEKILQDEIHNNIKQYKLLYNKLQKRYTVLTNKNIEIHQEIVKKLKNENENIKGINQKNQSKIESQEQTINRLRQTLELKENQIQNLEKEKEELEVKNNNLVQRYGNLETQLEDVKQNALLEATYQSVLGVATNFQRGDNDQNNTVNLNGDILELNDNIKKYITNLKQDIAVNMEEIKKLLLLYNCPTRIQSQKEDRLLIQAVLHRHVMEKIFEYANQYFQNTGKRYHLESDITKNESTSSLLLNHDSKCRSGNDEVTRIGPSELRQQIYSVLSNGGFVDIIGMGNTLYEHPFITYHKEKLNKIMNGLRVINNNQKKITSENLAATIIREVVNIFWFRLKVQEPVVQYRWIQNNTLVDKTLMEVANLDDKDEVVNSYVDLCFFPLIERDIDSNNRKIYTLAKVITKPKSNLRAST